MALERFRDARARRQRREQITEATTALRTAREGELDQSPTETPQQNIVPSEGEVWKSRAKKVALVGGVAAAAVVAGKYAFKDDETGKIDKKKATRSFGKAIAAGMAEGVAGVAGITIRHHRELTHRSLELSKKLQKAIDFEQRSLGVAEPYTWASVHEIHHGMEDTSLFPFYKMHHAMREAEARGMEVPDTFAHLDRFVDSFDRETVDAIGRMADDHLKERLADPRLGEYQYREPSFDDVTDEQLASMMRPNEPQYTYIPLEGRTKKLRPEDYDQDDIARLLLTDPHSPALEPLANGVQGILIEGMPRYQDPADMFRAIPLLKPEELQQPEDALPADQRKKKKSNAVAAGFALNAGAFFLANREWNLKGAARAALEGAAANGVRAGLEVSGGNVTNSAGHMGDPVQTEIGRAFLSREYQIQLKDDGTISTNTIGKGITGRVASWATLDEVGGQQIHHQEPWKIAYTNAEGVKAVVEAPWGSALEFLAKAEWFSLIKDGPGFGDQPRPDVAHPAVRIIQAERAKQYARDNTRAEEVVYST
jgi:hypothetical protein